MAVGSRKRLAAETGSLILVAAGVWLGWQVALQPLKERLPPVMALRLAPGSGQVLGRAAEAEYGARRFDNAEELARASLERTSFNVRALRTLGLSEAQQNRRPQANELLTLAGNWSLRDDPTHAWLIEYRLSRNDYHSAFAHADTLARRRADLQPRVFYLFNTAAIQDPRSLPALVSLLEVNPPWRAAYLNQLYRTADGHRIAATLAMALHGTRGPFTQTELDVLYRQLLSRSWLQAMEQVRARVGQPAPGARLVNGDFGPQTAPAPYEWRLSTGSGLVIEILPDDLREDSALRAQYGSLAPDSLAEQLLQLKPGRYRFAGEQRREAGKSEAGMSWTITCLEDGRQLAGVPLSNASETWRRFSTSFVVPAAGCQAQWLRLTPKPAHRRTTLVGWYDRLSVTPEPMRE